MYVNHNAIIGKFWQSKRFQNNNLEKSCFPIKNFYYYWVQNSQLNEPGPELLSLKYIFINNLVNVFHRKIPTKLQYLLSNSYLFRMPWRYWRHALRHLKKKKNSLWTYTIWVPHVFLPQKFHPLLHTFKSVSSFKEPKLITVLMFINNSFTSTISKFG